MNIGDILKQRRKAKGLTQIELAQKANMSQAQISQIEQGVSDNVTLGNGLIGANDTPSCKDFFDIAVTQCKAEKQPYSMTYDLGRVAMTRIRI